MRIMRSHGKKERDDFMEERLVTIRDPSSPGSEAYRTLRTNLLYSHVDTPLKVIVLTSSGAREGKSTTCSNLGVVLAQAGKNTLIVDCDFRKPVIHKIFGLRNLQGLADVLVSERSLQGVWHESGQEGLKVLPVGSIPPNPAELLGSKRFAEFLNQMRQEFDHVLVDAPPVGVVSDAAILASEAEGVLLILDAQHTRKGAFRQAIRNLEAVGADMLGVVMNNVKSSKDGCYYYNDYTYDRQ